ncbi:hypothetical protein BB561_003958 [Smittium simulii]|uniref:Reverse transcriptase domain-containing protein n=1 Tax=Smittium simulii TaxID=133385 RepID=A0A2T9YIR3_9FUNG|nr:hypothetical protein BB561_003958 [Smittium simulii]
MPKVPGVIPSAAAGMPYHSEKCTSLEYSTVAKTGLIDPTILFQKRLKRHATVALIKKIGCNWTQFSGNINAAIDYVALEIDDEYVLYQHDSKAKATYFMFYSQENAENFMNALIYYNGIAVELYQTVILEEGAQIITIPSINSININNVVKAVNNTFIKNEMIYDFSAYKNKSSGKFNTFDSKSEPKIGQNIVGLAPKSVMETTINTFFSNIRKKIIQEVDKKTKSKKNETISQLKAVKDETKPNKHQSLDFNNKNKELISKENIDRFTEFNIIKQQNESNDNENYTENNVSTATIDMDLVNGLADNNGFTDAEMSAYMSKNGNFMHEIHYNIELKITLSEAFKMLKGYTCVEFKKDLTKTGSGLLIAVKNKSEWSNSELRTDFRAKERCVAQATTLYEIIKRRELANIKTYIGFIDFKKAYDRVPHDQLFHKLEYSGIGGKLLQVIKVSVPGLDKKISGLLFADNAVIPAESADELQKLFDVLTES